MQDKKEIIAILNQYDLSSNISNLKVLPSFANKVWLIELKDKKIVIKNHITNPLDRIKKIHQIIRSLSAKNIFIPKIYKNKQEETLTLVGDKIYEISEYIDGEKLGTNDLIEKSAKLLAKIHDSNRSGLELDIINFEKLNFKINKLIEEFKINYSSSKLKLNNSLANRIKIIYDFLRFNERMIEKISLRDDYYKFQKSNFVLTHGDFSYFNIIYHNNDLYIVDWDNVKLRPRAFELQRAIGLICGKGYCNANLDEIDEEKARKFIKAYHNVHPLQKEDLDELVEVIEYTSLFYWLEFTLEQVLKRDYRILEIAPSSIDQAMYWSHNLKKYRDFLYSLI